MASPFVQVGEILRILISTTLQWPIFRQIPSSWKESGISVHINEPLDACDVWVVYQGLRRPHTVDVPPNQVYFFSYEPPGLHSYHPDFLSQFAKVVSCQDLPIDPNRLIKRHQAQPWLAGIRRHPSQNLHEGYDVRYTVDDFRTMNPPDKPKRFSAICSTKVMVPGHQIRLDFVRKLKERLGDQLDLFGYGFRPIEDKWDALESYQYHLVLENSCIPHYWTEKLADAFLANCYPVVWGCSNLCDYFPDRSFLSLDPASPDKSIELITQLLEIPLNAEDLMAISQARDLVIQKYNLFSEILALANSVPVQQSCRVSIKDERLFTGAPWMKKASRFLTDRWRL